MKIKNFFKYMHIYKLSQNLNRHLKFLLMVNYNIELSNCVLNEYFSLGHT